MAAFRPTRYLSELVDVSVATPASGDVLAWSATNSRWEAVAGTTIPVPVLNGGTGATTTSGARTNLGLGSLATLNSVTLTSQVTGILPVANGGTGTASPGLVAGSNVTISGTWPNQTIAATAPTSPGGSSGQIQYNNAGAFGGDNGLTYAATTKTTGMVRVAAPSTGRPFAGTESGITGLWHFDEGAGTTASDSVGTNHLTLASASWSASLQGVGTACATAYGSVANPLSTGAAWTLMGWWYSGTSVPSDTGIVSIGNTPTDGNPWLLVYLTSSLFRLWTNGNGTFSTVVPATGTWYHIAVTFDGASTVTLYINGAQAASRSTVGGNSTNLYIGIAFNGSSPGMRVDEWATFGSVLSADRIYEYAQQGPVAAGWAVGDSTGLIAFAPTTATVAGTYTIRNNATTSAGARIALGNATDTVMVITGTFNASTNVGPLTLRALASTGGVACSLDAAPAGGVAYSLLSTGSPAVSGAGCLAIYNNTQSRYDGTILSSGHFNLARGYFTDLAQVLIRPDIAATNVLMVSGISGQTAPLVTLGGRSSTTDGQPMAVVDAKWADSTHATRKGRCSVWVAGASATTSNFSTGTGWREALRVSENGTCADVVIPIDNVRDAADDAAAAALSPAVPVGGLYRTGSILKIRVS